MKIVVLGTENAWKELTEDRPEINWQRVENFQSLMNISDADAFFNLTDNAWQEDYNFTTLPVFVSSVTRTLKEIKGGTNVIRMNGWNSFIKRKVWEMSGNMSALHFTIAEALQKKLLPVADEPGYISARIISMIINEGCFAREENISSESEIDIAMKLGTNYPFGPFEWKDKIGVKNIYDLLSELAKTDERYKPSTLLTQMALG